MAPNYVVVNIQMWDANEYYEFTHHDPEIFPSLHVECVAKMEALQQRNNGNIGRVESTTKEVIYSAKQRKMKGLTM